ncbi:MAG: T9SS type A sorting domain-containing protein [Candidatus Kapabacteria bacterium]|nr:T9SS type A sorting domain-containing protein [Candidatus Kapabacteria bacterium]
MAFLPNVHSAGDSLYVAIMADSVCTGTLSYIDQRGASHSRPFTISDIRRPLQIGLDVQNVELQGINQGLQRSTQFQNERVLGSNVINITATSSLTVHILNKGNLSSDAAIVRSEAYLGTSYVLQTPANSHRMRSDTASFVDLDQSTPSQAVIIATVDSTVVNLSLTCDGAVSSTRKRTLLLNRGQCYFIQADIKQNDSTPQTLSGTVVQADKPISVFAGAQYASLPGIGTRNTCFEQCTPLEYWGTTVNVIPFPMPQDKRSGLKDWLSITTSYDGTVVSGNGDELGTIDIGETLTIPIDEAMYVVASKPVNVVQFRESSNVGTDTTLRLGDMNMMSLIPVNNYQKKFILNCVQVREGTRKVFVEQYVCIIAPTVATSSIQIDGAKFPITFTSLPNSSYSYGYRRVSDGIHTIECDEPCMVYTVGYGSQDAYSYAATGGTERYPYCKTYISATKHEQKAGDLFTLSVKLDSIVRPSSLINFDPKSIAINVRFNATLMTPSNVNQRGMIDSGYQTIQLLTPISLQESNANLATIQMIAGLGDNSSTDIEVRDLEWRDGNGLTIPTELIASNGKLQLTDIWSDTLGNRYVNPQERGIAMTLGPNPMVGNGMLYYTLPSNEETFSLVIYDAMGDVVADLTNEMKTKGIRASLLLERKFFNAGVYYARLTFGSAIVVRSLIVQ